ncbi:hypothetical protein B0H10DRAFT_2019985 [Mycena sp. CBHHK59/15]|nr:hypothetical protein B0H10DRAFT_2145816 [Mycena sp. CBHHK59/15]KAJ6605770.1 hypothetical protein B0H10DRAFT_2076218 [Mycena sp. CBHHK59/15]KAJ6611046.1 hypothetical protein B0H10DRAFT_2057880 [Mycena sp. CBHHK59/15]KAJ6616891.1 hypothetical protein B0H10DRAFT_2035579 [Mycena sp. CBHHK59/15]KAJ6620909.1 hypothetical protein B0H10DRAFT_2019985 [Mycena sp. CBHHK59/15]
MTTTQRMTTGRDGRQNGHTHNGIEENRRECCWGSRVGWRQHLMENAPRQLVTTKPEPR